MLLPGLVIDRRWHPLPAELLDRSLVGGLIASMKLEQELPCRSFRQQGRTALKIGRHLSGAQIIQQPAEPTPVLNSPDPRSGQRRPAPPWTYASAAAPAPPECAPSAHT